MSPMKITSAPFRSAFHLDQVQVIAAQEGIPYQTLISSIIHKYVSGYLLEKKRA